MSKVEDFNKIKIRLASPEDILHWSKGEVIKPETINYRTQRPEKDGLFCEKIFGPTRDYECYCGKYKKIRYKGVVCDKCGVEVTKATVRRERMGHIKLAVPVAHIWFLRGIPSKIGLLLSQTMQQIEKVIYFISYIVTKVDENAKKGLILEIKKEYSRKEGIQKKAKLQDKGIGGKKKKKEKDQLKEALKRALAEVTSIKKGMILDENDYRRYALKYGEIFEAGIGADAIRKMLKEIDLKKDEEELKKSYDEANADKKKEIQQKLNLIKSLIKSQVHPEWMCLTYLPVLPPDLRPMVQLDGGRYASSDLNDLYRRVINRNNRLRYLKTIGAPEVITRNEKRMLQEAVDALIDNGSRKPQMVGGAGGAGEGKRQLKSLADMLKGKQGRFRQNLLGKRIDYSGRSVIVVGPNLALEEVGIPKKMALELFKPFIINEIMQRGLAHNVRAAGILIAEEQEIIWEILEKVTKGKFVLLNRAPTLHRLSVQAFRPVLIEGEAIQLHPLVCPAFNADFDGDQMAVHLPLSRNAQKESKELMISVKGILKPATGQPIAVPRQEMILGCYWLTTIKPGVKGEGKIFPDATSAKLASEFDKVDIQAEIKVRMNGEKSEFIKTSVGRLIFNEILPEDYPFQNKVQDAKRIQRLISMLIEKYGNETVVPILDKIKNLGFEYATISSTTWGMDDLICPKQKGKMIQEANKKEEEIKKQFSLGFLSEQERRNKIIEVWQGVKDDISDMVPEIIPKFGSVFTIINSGARGSWSQPSQMAGMKGLVINPSGDIIELPVKNSYKEGLNTLEYFISTHGARKGTVDTALRTSNAGYLTRRLVDVAHELIIREKDCGDEKGIIVSKKDAEETDQDFSQKIIGRISLQNIEYKNKAILKKGDLIDEKAVRLINKSDVEKIRVRSPLSCKSIGGICQACYGSDLSLHKMVELGTAVGIIAAQAIGEPGTQLTMRTFHTGGVAGIGDITLGLPRVEELFEARSPKGEAMIFEEKGKVKNIVEKKDGLLITVEIEKKGKKEIKEYEIPVKGEALVKKGDEVFPGQPIFEGRIDVKKLFKAVGEKKTQKYILKEVQRIYAGEGVTIHDKHIETILRQMYSRVKITDAGDSIFSPGEVVSKSKFFEENQVLQKSKKKLAIAKPMILGLIKVALSADSFLSAASFQETSKILIKAAIDGEEDELKGLKENVIIGKLIPAGTGFKQDRK